MKLLPLDDKLYHDLLRAQMAMQDLCPELHYPSYESGVGRVSKGMSPWEVGHH